uniref:Ephrin RBD domain-containing protein n=1 Tax=Caenorhabditis tropicalis TaxID=1561998 RepID=A0A1I7UB61_9PELO
MGDVVRFVCPDNSGRNEAEYLTVYEVTEFSLTDCALETNAREVLRCGVDTLKQSPKSIAQLIRQLNPIPNGKEYQPGQTYYYITTSNGKANGINHRMYGLCESQNMRLAMKVMASQPPTPSVKQKAPIRRQEDFVTKSSNELMGGQEDEDSENDNAHLLPRALETATNPKFRRPSQFEQAAASAGVQDQQFMKVVQMAKEGRTGTFENERRQGSIHKSMENDGWHPVNVQYVADLMSSAYKNADERISYQRENDFLIHEENDIAMKSLEYSSSSSPIQIFFSLLIAVVLLY